VDFPRPLVQVEDPGPKSRTGAERNDHRPISSALPNRHSSRLQSRGAATSSLVPTEASYRTTTRRGVAGQAHGAAGHQGAQASRAEARPRDLTETLPGQKETTRDHHETHALRLWAATRGEQQAAAGPPYCLPRRACHRRRREGEEKEEEMAGYLRLRWRWRASPRPRLLLRRCGTAWHLLLVRRPDLCDSGGAGARSVRAEPAGRGGPCRRGGARRGVV
jgi:hypothetical protein